MSDGGKEKGDTMTLYKHITKLIDKHGGLRPAARALQIDPAYLSRIRSEEKTASDATLKKLGLERIVTITYKKCSLPRRKKQYQ